MDHEMEGGGFPGFFTIVVEKFLDAICRGQKN